MLKSTFDDLGGWRRARRRRHIGAISTASSHDRMPAQELWPAHEECLVPFRCRNSILLRLGTGAAERHPDSDARDLKPYRSPKVADLGWRECDPS